MRILLIDDEALLLEDLEETVKEVVPEADYVITQSPKTAMDAALVAPFDVAFVDVEMPGMNGLELATELRNIYKKTNIVFVTAYTQYALDAHGIMSSGYFLKPLKKKDVELVMQNLRYPVADVKNELVVNCFGQFEVFFGGKVVEFKRSLAKEILACLVDQKGSRLTKNEIIGILWPEADDTSSKDKSFYMGIVELKRALQSIHMEAALVHSNTGYAVDLKYFDGDYVRFINGDKGVLKNFRHEYMNQYSWAEETLGFLESESMENNAKIW